RCRVLTFWQRRIDFAPVHIRAKSAITYSNGAAIRMFPKFLEGRRGGSAATLGEAGLLLCDHGDRTVEADGENILHRLEIGIGAVMKQERAVATDAGGNHLAGFRVQADIAWK